MKIPLWLFTMVVIIVCVSCWAVSHLVVQAWRIDRAFDGRPLPSFTHLVLLPSWWLLICPVPWMIYAGWQTLRKDITSRALFIFIGTVFVGMSVVVASVALAALMPYADLISHHP
jgi:hypothetical protein